MNLPRLYKLTKTGAIQICDISTTDNIISVVFGQLDGKLQTKLTTCFGKNSGKANATTDSEQADFDAQSKWNKKVKSGYTEDPSGEILVKLPQKVKPYIGNESKVKFPCYSTYKLNGVNATYWLLSDGSLKLTSRGGDEYPPIPHLEEDVLTAMHVHNCKEYNAELYIHGQHLQDITSAVKKPKELSKKLTFNLFEIPDINGPYSKKSRKLWALKYKETDYFKVLAPKLCNSPEELDEHFNEAIEAGYEGTVIYNADAEYKFNERSNSVFKYKIAQDAEFEYVSYKLDKNGHPVLTCKTDIGLEFDVKPKGTAEERTQLISYLYSLTGVNWYKVEFETWSKAPKPLKPIGLGFRNCNLNGDPLE